MMLFPPPLVIRHYSDARRCSLLLLAALLSIIPASRAQDKATALPAAFGEQVEQRVIALTNEFRGTGGLQPLESEAHLADAARYFAAHLAGSGKLEHDADGTTPAERVKKRGYNYCAVAENLASEFNPAGFTPETLSRNVVQGWRDSPTHRANMLHPDVTQIGVGVARSPKDGEYYVVQVFGRPMSQMVRFRVTNRSNALVRYDYRKRPVALAAKQTRMHESCVAGDLKLDAPGQDVAVRPRDGGRYAIVEAGRGAYRLTEE